MTIVEPMQGPAELPPNMQQAMQLAREVQAQSQALGQVITREQLREQIREQVRTEVRENVRRDLESAARRGEFRADQVEQMVERIAEQAAEQAADQAEALALGAGRGRLMRPQGTPETRPARLDPSQMIPPQVVDISIAFLIAVVVTIVGLPIARAWARRMDRRSVPAASPEVSGQLRQLQQSVEAIAIEVERISEAQRYTARMLTEGAAQSIEAKQGERVGAR